MNKKCKFPLTWCLRSLGIIPKFVQPISKIPILIKLGYKPVTIVMLRIQNTEAVGNLD